MGLIYVGPYGRLMAMDVGADGFDSGMTEFGALQEPLSGMHTKDVFGWKRSFNIPLDGMDRRALSWFEMLYRGSIAGPYFLRDPRRMNMLHAAVADTMSSYARTVPFVAPNGVVSAQANTKLMLTSQRVDVTTTTETTPGPSFAAKWVATAAGAVACGKTVIPVIPGETVIFSFYLISGSATPGILTYATPGASPVTVTVTVLTDPTDATRKYIRYTVPTNGTVQAVMPTFNLTAAGTTVVLAGQLEGQRATTDTPRAWVLGTGVPKVIVNDFPQHSEYLGTRTSGSLALLEA
jgi:hypothetical protein